VLYHHRTASDDGQAIHVHELQAAFVRAGHSLREVALVKRSGGSDPKGSRLGAFARRVPRFVREVMERGYNVAGARALDAAVAEFRPDLLYERTALFMTCGAEVARRHAIPYLVEANAPLVDESEEHRGLAFPRAARRAEARVLGAADGVCVVSGTLRDWAVSRGVPRERVLWTPNGVDLARFQPGAKDARLAERLGVAGKTVVGFTGFMREWHRLDLALEAFAARGLARDGAVLLLVGDGPARAGLEARALTLGLDGAARFAGRVEHATVPDVVRLFDVAVLPAINAYASPLKLFEYLATGVATLTVDQPNLREVLDDGAVRFVPAGDAAALGAAMRELVSDPALRARVAARGREHLLARDFTWDGNVRRIAEFLSARAAKPAAGAGAR